ncbi:MAG: hypothetical protein ACOYO1_19035 [Bacteroidales bacterium]
MKKLLLLTLLNLIAISHVFTQDIESGKKVKNGNAISSEYNRNALTLILLDFNKDNYNSEIKNVFNSYIQIPAKFDNNMLAKRTISANQSREAIYKIEGGKTIKNADGTTTKEKTISGIDRIKNLLYEEKITNQVISKWFNRNQNGEFNMELIEQRGINNAKDADYIAAKASKRGESVLKDAGEKLLKKSYIFVCDYTGIRTMQEIYDAMDDANRKYASANNTEFKPVKRTENGFKGHISVYLYKVDFGDSISSIFYNQLWVDNNFPQNTEDKNNRINLFNSFNFPVSNITSVYTEAEGTQKNADQGIFAPAVQLTKQELFSQLVASGIDNAITQIENVYSDFKVKAPIISTNPIGIKIGTKEGLKLDQRYFVLEKREDNDGKAYTKRMAVIRSKKVIDNSKVTGGKTDTSFFYQIAGRQIDNMGMYAEQSNDLGMGVFIGYTFAGEIGGLSGRGEYNISQLFGSTNAPTAMRAFVEGGIDIKKYPEVIGDKSHGFIRLGIGFEKDFYFLRNFHICPFVAYDYEMMQFKINETDEDPYSYHTFMFHTGLRMGVNLHYNLQFITSVNYFIPGNVNLSKGDVTLIESDIKWSDYFKDRKGMTIECGLRYQF